MSEEIMKSVLSARSRAPIDSAGIAWWDNFGTRTVHEDVQQNNEPKFKDKSTNTNTLTRQTQTSIFRPNLSTKDRVLKKWKQERSKTSYEQARNAIINSLKEKFRENERKIGRGKKAENGKAVTFIEIIRDNVEETSNSNVNRDAAAHCNLDFKAVRNKVEFSGSLDEDVSHARAVRMEPGGEVAQWRLAVRGSSAAGAALGERGFAGNMPVSTRELLR